MLSPELERKLKHLRLSGMAQVFAVRLQQAVSGRLSHQEFLELLVEDELTRRRDRLRERRMRQAAFPERKRLEDFNFSFNPSINRQQIFDLATGRFVSEGRGWLIIGQTGVGKSHLIIAVGIKLVENGIRTIYRSSFDLLEDIAEATATGTRREFITEMTSIPVLIIEDLGLRKIPPAAAEDLLELLHRRYQKTSTILSSNRPLEDWGIMLGGDTAATSTLLDRFLHHSEVTLIRGKSYRLYERQQREKSHSKSNTKGKGNKK
jgi:DNA replication protein DnaC